MRLGHTLIASLAAATFVVAANEKRATTKLSGCHFHGSTQFCIGDDGEEGSIEPSPLNPDKAPTSYSGCHLHGLDTFCLSSSGDEVQFVTEGDGHGEGHEHGGEGDGESSGSSSGKNCHFHAGVEHCIGEGESENDHSKSQSCERVDRDYNIRLRIGLIFAVLATSSFAAVGPILLSRFFKFSTDGTILTCIKQFGTGVILSTAFVHLTTHAALMWGNSCISLGYESTSTAITMAGVFLVFVIEYVASKFILSRKSAYSLSHVEDDKTRDMEKISSSDETVLSVENLQPEDKFSVMLMEAGIIFHSILIGVTLVVAGDSYFITLFIVILFHQMFEGVALGSRIAAVHDTSTLSKLVMAMAFGITTPIGMAIGTGTLHSFNGNDPSTIIALGTLDSLSAGVLIWTGLVEMLAHDWVSSPLANAGWLKSGLAMILLVAGMILMSFIGKWA